MRASYFKISITTLVLCLLGTTFAGCNADPRARREMALMRAEILDLEDQFYMMKSQYESANRELQSCRGIPVDGAYLGASSIEGEYIDGGFVAGTVIESGDIIYDSPVQSGRYIPHATQNFRDSARRIFQRNAPQQPQPQSRKRGFGLFNGWGTGLFRRNQPSAEPLTDFDSQFVDVGVPQMAIDTGQPTLASTPKLTGHSARGRDGNSPTTLDPADYDPIDLELSFDEPGAEDYSPQDNVVFDEVDDLTPSDNRGNGLATTASRETVTQVDISPKSTYGQDLDGQPGHEGVVVLIQPKDRNGALVKQTGEITVSLIDPSAAGEQQRIGLWKFTPDEVRLFEVKDESSEQGYLLHLPWDGNVPRTQDLLLYVRYWTQDGRRLETSKRLAIEPPETQYSTESPLIEGWTRRDPRWDRNNKTPENPDQRSLLADDPTIPNLKGETRDSGKIRRGIKATPASTTITRPKWRPSR